MNNRDKLKLLGEKVFDRVTGLCGIVTSVSFDISGCVQGLVQPQAEEGTGKIIDAKWFDLNRLKIHDGHRVMEAPDFSNALDIGPENKPIK